MHIGSKGWPVFSDPTDALLLPILLKKLMLALLARCQNTQCIAVYCAWGCKAADQSGCPFSPLSTTRSNGMEWNKVVWSEEPRSLLHHVDGWMRLPGEHMAPGCTMGRRKPGRGSVMLWTMFCWENLGPAIHVDVTLTCTTYLSIVADHAHPFIETVFPDGCGLVQQDIAPCHKEKSFRNCLRNTKMSLRC